MHNRSNGGAAAPGPVVAVFGWAAAVILSMLATGAPARAQDAMLVLEANTGDILYAQQEDEPLHPASLTKMMTLYMAFEAMRAKRLKPDQALRVSYHAAAQPPSRLRLRKGTKIKASNAILALITKSANDAAVVLAEALADDERDFARAMTRRARQLGMADTVFRNASGLHDDDQITTARDMAKLAMALLRDYPGQYKKFATRSFSWRGRRYANHNPLLSSYEGADGIKTGYIRQSGFNIVGSAERDGRRIIVVVLGGKTAQSRDWSLTTLLDYGFQQLAGDPAQGMPRDLPYIANPTGEKALNNALRGVRGTTRVPNRRRPTDKAGLPSPLTGIQRPQAKTSSAPKEWAVQVGAYPSTPPAKEAALTAKAKIPELLGASQPSFPAVTRGGSRFYRARLVGLTEIEARSACRRLANHEIPCLAIGDDGAFKASLAR